MADSFLKNIKILSHKIPSKYRNNFDITGIPIAPVTKWSVAYMQCAHNFAKLSHAKRAKVGAVAVTPSDVMIYSYNGTASGDDNTCECVVDGQLKTLPEVLHAERNIIAKAAKEGISLKGSSVYITMAPCLECSLMLFQAGVKYVYFGEEYRCTDGIEYLLDHDVGVVQLVCEGID